MPIPIEPNELPASELISKHCTVCGEFLPLYSFHLDESKPDGHRDVCKECRAAMHAEKVEGGLDPRLSALEEEALVKLEGMSTGGTFVPAQEELLESIMRMFGGVDGYARTLYATVYATPPGSARRIKVLDMIMKLVQSTSLRNNQTSLDKFSEDELRKLMLKAITETQKPLGLPHHELPPMPMAGNTTIAARPEASQ